MGAIGVGARGQDVMSHFLAQKNCQVVALADVKSDVLNRAKGLVDGKYGNQDCKTYADFRELTARADIDGVLIASTDHWHVLHALSAVRSGKDVYVEKPLGLSLEQDKVLRREVQKRKRIFQFGTQQRSDPKFRLACELALNGYIGKLKHINVWAPPSVKGGTRKVVSPPSTINYDFWLGPAPRREHTEDLTSNAHWWYVSDFALGFIAGWGIHPIDIALWGAGELAGGMVEVKGHGNFPTEGLHDTATSWSTDFSFSSGMTMKFVSTPGDDGANEEFGKEWTARYGKITGHGTAFEGTNGWIRVDRERIDTMPADLVELQTTPDKITKKLVRSSDHVRNFLEAVKSRNQTVSPIESAVLSDAFCHLADAAIRFKRSLRYNVKAERISGDKAANNRLQERSMRSPWKL